MSFGRTGWDYINIFSGFSLKGRETDWLPEMPSVGGVGRPSAVSLLFQHPAHSTRPQTLEIDNILNTVVLFHNIPKNMPAVSILDSS